MLLSQELEPHNCAIGLSGRSDSAWAVSTAASVIRFSRHNMSPSLAWAKALSGSNEIAFWKIIGGILRDHPCVLYWPGTSAVMGSLDLLPHLPKVMVEKLGVPLVSIDPERIRQHVRENS